MQAHSGMTAEGDNRVLMQKVVKDIFEHTQKKKHDAPKFEKSRLQELAKTDVLNLETMRDLIFMKEPFMIKYFGKIL
jgi:acyl-CoA oxidase